MCRQPFGDGRATILESSSVVTQALLWSVCMALEATGRLQHIPIPVLGEAEANIGKVMIMQCTLAKKSARLGKGS